MGRVDGVIPRFSTALNNARVRNTLGYAGSCNGNRRNNPADALLAHFGEGDLGGAVHAAPFI